MHKMTSSLLKMLWASTPRSPIQLSHPLFYYASKTVLVKVSFNTVHQTFTLHLTGKGYKLYSHTVCVSFRGKQLETERQTWRGKRKMFASNITAWLGGN